MDNTVDRPFTPAILDEDPRAQEMCYRDVLNYCKILQGEEWPWSELYMDTCRADIHNRIAEYCDCDSDVVTRTIDAIFYPDEFDTVKSEIAFSEENFLGNVDRLVNDLKDVARLPERERWPSMIPESALNGIAREFAPVPNSNGKPMKFFTLKFATEQKGETDESK